MYGYPANYHKPSTSKYPWHHAESSEYPKKIWIRSMGTYVRGMVAQDRFNDLNKPTRSIPKRSVNPYDKIK